MLLVSEEALAEREDAIVEALRKPYLDAARSMLQAVDELETRLTDDVVDLAARIAQALTYREFTTDKSLVLEVAQRALRLVGPLERLTVRCAPEDAELLRDNLPGLARVEVGRAVEVVVRPSDDILPGGLLLTFDGGVVDAREERRAARIVEAVKAAIREARQDQVSESTPASAGAETEVKS
jgi:flagellar biosynthesis/type III secretory pathway protein FliH